MITLLIALLFGGGCFAASYCGLDSLGWGITLGIVGFLVVQVASSLLIRKKVMREMERVQLILADGQKKLQTKMQRWQMRPPGSIQAAQREIFEDTKVFVKAALGATEALSRYRLWMPMIDRQKATAQLQLNWMIKDFRKVDELMPKALFLDPTMMAMKLARMYMLNGSPEEMKKVYNRSVRRLKYNQNVLLAACYSWILVKRDKADEAFRVLTEALKNSDNPTLKQNHEHLMNNRVAHFGNAGLGDQWYALMLEEPKVRMQRPRSAYR
ncbi:MAG: tetratricopeptide repeat protein [Kiritimatiellia bacterium]